ncbi:head decoration protein [Martelella mediterranea]|uniref:Bacteriophage lambda head decoration protein D n=1 Tax=Martelella mediterranea TaxID=293089 RepID=A0A4R3NIZ0_9HYPH|nr:head decoration protein [Martelella mediterranea]TCT34701.1 bacteriophage lambda head decoration protein D [Martelella mediterranea]
MATARFAPNDLIVSDIQVVTRTVTIASGQTLDRGAVLGEIAADGKHTLSLAASEDGSETPDCVLAFDVEATGADVEAQAYFGGAFDAAELTFGAGHDAASVEQAFRRKGAALFVRHLD